MYCKGKIRKTGADFRIERAKLRVRMMVGKPADLFEAIFFLYESN